MRGLWFILRDYTADALHQFALGMGKFYESQVLETKDEVGVSCARNNAYDIEKNVVVLNDAQVYAWTAVRDYYRKHNNPKTNIFGQIFSDSDVDMSAFYLWGAWLSAAARPGETYSYTHNWPHEPLAGNESTPAVILWSAISVLVLFVGLMITLYCWGQLAHEDDLDDGVDIIAWDFYHCCYERTTHKTHEGWRWKWSVSLILQLFQLM